MDFKYKPSSEEFKKDPHFAYDIMRQEQPVYMTSAGTVVLTRYNDIVRTLRNPKSSVDFLNNSTGSSADIWVKIQELRKNNPLIGNFVTMLRADDPDHARMKNLTIPYFSGNAVLGMAKTIEGLVDKYIKALPSTKNVAISEQLTKHIPIDLIMSILKFPMEDKEQLVEWTDLLTFILEPVHHKNEGLKNTQEIMPKMYLYFKEKIDERRRNPLENDVITDLLTKDVNGQFLEEKEVISTVGILLVAGIETVVFFLANAIYALASNPKAKEQWIEITSKARQRGDGFYTDKEALNAVDELLRHSGSVGFTSRVNLEDFEYENNGEIVTVPAGTVINCVLLAANRDPEIFTNPHSIDLYRDNANRHITFSAGVHYCLGASLGKLEALILLDKLFNTFPNLMVVNEPTWKDRMTFRGIDNLKLDLS